MHPHVPSPVFSPVIYLYYSDEHTEVQCERLGNRSTCTNLGCERTVRLEL